MKANFVFVDTSFFKALIDDHDDFHRQACDIWGKIKTTGFLLSTTNFVLDETFTLIRKRRGLKVVKAFKEILIKNAPGIKVIRISSADEAEAWDWFQKDWSNLSFTDCTSFVVMKKTKISKVATFDQHFSRARFEILV